MDQQPLPPTPAQEQPQQEDAPNYTWLGVLIALIVALALVGGVYFKMRSDILTAQSKQNVVPTAMPTPTSLPLSFFVEPTSAIVKPALSPVVVQSKQDVLSQDAALDSIDLSSVSAELDKNILDATDFAQ